MKIQERGYIIDINGIDQEKLDLLMCGDGFRAALMKAILPWAWNHPAGKPRSCWGITLNTDVAADMIYFKEIGAALHFVQPRRFSCPASTT